MTDHRAAMLRALREVLVPLLRERGFKGSLPHFHRILPDRVDYLSVQFHSAGGSFVVEIAGAGPDGKPRGLGADRPVQMLSTFYFVDRLRLGTDRAARKTDHWYDFGPRSFDPPLPLRPADHYLAVARQVVLDFERQADPWFLAHAGAA